VLDTSADVARAMLHLHKQNVLHSDLKARNVLLKSEGEGRGVVAKGAGGGGVVWLTGRWDRLAAGCGGWIGWADVERNGRKAWFKW